MKLKQIIELLEARWPSAWAETWDQVGLQVGDEAQEVLQIGVALDWNERTYRRLSDVCDLVLTHHPTFFRPVPRLTTNDPKQALLIATIRSSLSVWAAHTNLDSAPDATSVSRCLVRALGLEDGAGSPLVPADLAINPGGGLGWVLDPDLTRSELVARLEALTGYQGMLSNNVRHAQGGVGRVAFWGGSWDREALPELLKRKVDTLVAGEIGYHDQDDLRSYGIDAIMIGHATSEIPALRPWAEACQALLEASSGESITFHVDTGDGELIRLS